MSIVVISLQLHAGLALYGGEQTGTDVSRTMDWNRHRLPIFRQHVVAAANTVDRPTGGLQLRDDFMASHFLNDRSKMVYLPPN
jgi:hypothetical protein